VIDDLDRTLRQLLAVELPAVRSGAVEVAFNQPTHDWSKNLGKPTLNFFLYDVRDNPVLRRHQWQALAEPGGAPREDHTVRQRRTPLRIDCFYLVTAWSPADAQTRPFEEHNLLAQCLIALARYPVLNRLAGDQLAAGRSWTPRPVTANGRNGQAQQAQALSMLAGALDTQEYEIRARLASHDVMTNPAELWGSLDNEMRAGFSYVVTLPIDPWVGMEQAASEVGAATFTAKAIHPLAPAPEDRSVTLFHPPPDAPPPAPFPAARPSAPSSASTTRHKLGGVVRGERGGAGIAGVTVSLLEAELHRGVKNIGLMKTTHTDAAGRFRFAALPAGAYVIVVGADLHRPLATVESTLPGEGAIDIVIGMAP
jgi:hypothetical protein